MKTRALAALVTFSLLSASCFGVPEGRAEADLRTARAARRPATARLKIAVIPKGTTHEFWKSVHAGAAKAAKEVDVDIVWKGPLKEDDLKAQVDVVSTFVAQGVSGIVLAPLNDTALRAPVKQATQAKIPVVVFDSDLQGDDHVSFVATDNRRGGQARGRAHRRSSSATRATSSCFATRRAPRARRTARRASSRR